MEAIIQYHYSYYNQGEGFSVSTTIDNGKTWNTWYFYHLDRTWEKSPLISADILRQIEKLQVKGFKVYFSLEDSVTHNFRKDMPYD